MFVKQVLGEVHVDAFEPARNGIHAGGLVDDAGVGAAVDQVDTLEALVPELRAFGYGVLVQFPECLPT